MSRNSSGLEKNTSLLSMRQVSSTDSLSSAAGSGGGVRQPGLRPTSSTSSLSLQMQSSASSSTLQHQHQKRRMVQSTSLRKIHESGLQEAMRDNPVRMKRLLSSRIVQQHLNNTLPYRRKLIVVARAFVAVFRLAALSKGHSLTRQISFIEDQAKSGRAAHVNDIVDKRKAALDLLLQMKKEKEQQEHEMEEAKLVAAAAKDRAVMMHFRPPRLTPRVKEADISSNASAPNDRRRPGQGHRRMQSRDAVAKVFSLIS
jgi:hypothetical protein